jgi:hypothetical protein
MLFVYSLCAQLFVHIITSICSPLLLNIYNVLQGAQLMEENMKLKDQVGTFFFSCFYHDVLRNTIRFQFISYRHTHKLTEY